MSYDGPHPFSVGIGGTSDSSVTAFMPLCGGTTGTSAWQSVATGTTGSVLTFNSSSSLPSWSARGNLVLVNNQTFSGVSSVSVTTGISSKYNNYLLLLSNLQFTTNGAILEILFSTNGGSSYLSSGYSGGIMFAQTSAGATWQNGASTTFINLGTYNPANTPVSWPIYIMDMQSGAATYAYSVNANDGYTSVLGQSCSNTINALKLLVSTGTFSGEISLFGFLE
jgi:hypothetical protein